MSKKDALKFDNNMPIEVLLLHIIHNELLLEGIDHKSIVQKMQKELIHTVKHLRMTTVADLNTIKIPIAVKACMRKFCKVEVKTENNKKDSEKKQQQQQLTTKEKEKDKEISSTSSGSINVENLSKSAGKKNVLPITPEEVEWIKDTWRAVTLLTDTNENGDTCLTVFYDTVWEKWTKTDPLAERIYRTRGFKSRASHLMTIMTVLVQSAENSSSLSSRLNDITIPHCIWNVSAKQFSILAVAIIEGFNKVLKDKFKPEHKEAWFGLVTNIGKMMTNNFPQLRQGWEDKLLKRSIGSSWKEFHTVLTDDTLIIYKSSSMKRLIDRIDLASITEVDEISEDSQSSDGQPIHCFAIIVNSTRKVFAATSSAKLETWMHQLRLRCRAYSRMNDDTIYSITQDLKNTIFKRAKLTKSSKTLNLRPHLDAKIRSTSEFSVFDSLTQCTIVINTEGIIEYVNPATIDLTGYEPSELIGKNVTILMLSEDAKNHHTYLRNYLETGERKIIGIGRRVHVKRCDNTHVVCNLTVTEHVNTGSKLFIGTLSEFGNGDEVSDRSSSESQNVDFSLFDNINNATIVVNRECKIVYANEAVQKFTGYSQNSLMGENVSVLMPGDVASKHDDYVLRYLQTGESSIIGKGRDVIYIDNKGEKKHGHLEVTVHYTRRNEISHFIGTLTPHQFYLEEFIRQQSTVLHELQVASIIITQDGIIRAFSREASKLFGFNANYVIGKNVNILMPKEYARKHNTFIQNYLSTGKAKVIGKGRVVAIKCRDGTLRTSHLTVSIKRQSNLIIFIGMFTMISAPEDSDNDSSDEHGSSD
eukprot:TRINITY_DN3059_c0_g1_i1.p1 TRINITY_DN3059_c0_g1~~TRINITY_DN3059_c0_g1_i1.p1  ORF type:complete len:814 (+),score=164.05 TRINITY_DN3059_c0_g1_i1:27-2468(+)